MAGLPITLEELIRIYRRAEAAAGGEGTVATVTPPSAVQARRARRVGPAGADPAPDPLGRAIRVLRGLAYYGFLALGTGLVAYNSRGG